MRKILTILLLITVLGNTGCAAAYEGSDTAQQDYKISQDFERIDGYDNLYY